MKTNELVIVYNERTISIPFKNIALIDEFTTGYSNMEDIGKSLNQILDLNLNDLSVKEIYIIKRTKNKDKDAQYTEYLPIKYNYDMFDYESVKYAYVDYLTHHRSLLLKEGTILNIVTLRYLNKYSKIDIKDSDIYMIASAYLKTDYNRYRSAYFTLIENGYQIKKSPPPSIPNNYNRIDLTKYNPKDEYFEYLIDYSKIGEEERANAMDILASYSQEEILKNMENDDYGLFDNRHINRNIEDEALLLQILTNMSIQDIINIINDYQAKNKSKGRK